MNSIEGVIASRTNKVVRAERPKAVRRMRRMLAVLLAAAGLLGLASTTASAAAYPNGVYAPNRINSSQIQGWANLSLDCSGTYGCWNYIKIERYHWYGPEYINGWWAGANGWNSITANLPWGCSYYRTTTDSYNDVAGSWGAGVNIGQVGWTYNGTRIYRFRTTWSSGWSYQCR